MRFPRSLTDYPNHVDPPDPVTGRRITGSHWWDPDRIRHVRDLPNFCPACGDGIQDDDGIAVEYWEGENRVYHVWCHGCGWSGDVIRVHRMIGHESPH